MRHLLKATMIFLLCTAASAAAGDEKVVLQTTLGDLVVGLDREAAPKHVEQFLKLVRSGSYDSTPFHFVDPNFLIQLSNVENRRLPQTPEEKSAVRLLKAEFSARPMVAGTLIMARLPDDPDSGASSFSILLQDAPHLAGRYTVFGRVEWGMDVAGAIASVEVDGEKQPQTPVEVEKASVVDSMDMSKMTLRGPMLLPPRPVDVPGRLVGFIAVMLLMGVVHYFAADRVSRRTSKSILLLEIFIGFFALFVVLLPASSLFPWLPVALFAALLAVIKLMGRFESKQ